MKFLPVNSVTVDNLKELFEDKTTMLQGFIDAHYHIITTVGLYIEYNDYIICMCTDERKEVVVAVLKADEVSITDLVECCRRPPLSYTWDEVEIWQESNSTN